MILRLLILAEGGVWGVVWAQGSYEPIVSLGQIILAALVSLAALIGIFYGARYKVSNEANAALAEARGEALDDAAHRNKELQEALARSTEANAQLRQTVEKLESLPNLAKILELMNENAVRAEEARARQFHEADEHAASRAQEAVTAVMDRLDNHEARAQERFEKTMVSAESIVKSLGAIERKLNGRG